MPHDLITTGAPCITFSMLRFERDDSRGRRGRSTKPFISHVVSNERARLQRQVEKAGGAAVGVKLKGVSYDFLLTREAAAGESGAYDPFYLDDPSLQSGKHRMVMNLPGFIESVRREQSPNRPPNFVDRVSYARG